MYFWIKHETFFYPWIIKIINFVPFVQKHVKWHHRIYNFKWFRTIKGFAFKTQRCNKNIEKILYDWHAWHVRVREAINT